MSEQSYTVRSQKYWYTITGHNYTITVKGPINVVEIPKRYQVTRTFLFMATGQDREKSKLTVASTAENASDSDRNSKSAAAKLAAKVERFKQSRKSHSETRIVGGVAINTTVGKDVPLSVQSSSVSVKSEPELDNIKNKVHV